MLVSGESGCGKSTLFKVLAGVWPFCDGSVRRPAGRTMFLPQRCYSPRGSLRRALYYPMQEGGVSDRVLAQALESCGLAHLAGALGDSDSDWGSRLSGGEQQRLAIARALVAAPDWLFLDEATASLDDDEAVRLYAVLKQQLPSTTLVSIAHDTFLAQFHQRRLMLAGRPWVLTD